MLNDPIRLPEHKCGLELGHNPHRNYHETVAAHLDRPGGDDLYDFQNSEARQRCIDTDELWTLQWYPDTPIGFIAVAAPTLAELLDFANTGDHTT